jgi:four helix bundle protein
MTVRYFEELEIWKEARRLTGEIYRHTKTSKFARDFSLTGQIRRAVFSIMSNIAEGFAGTKSSSHFFISRRVQWRGPITGVYSI